jgi:signal transduction histidine kinase
MDDTRRRFPPDPEGLLATLLYSPPWALPFALFFGTLFGAHWRTYRLAYIESLVFTVFIRVAMWLTGRGIVPRIRRAVSGEGWLPITLAHVAMALAASYAAAFAINRLVEPGFLGSPGALLVVTMWSLLFSVMFAGVILARRFYREKVQHAAQVERVRAELVRAELRALQAQVNPHFLFNTLNSIAALISENPAAAEDLTTRLADVFRYALTASRRELVPLGEELQFVRTCLTIEQVRFGERLRVVERIEPGLADMLVPALLLQPLVENAVRYAVSPSERGGTVRIEIARSDDSLHVLIADDGPGFDPGEAPRGTGVGLESVRERLRLAGEGHALELDTAPGRGTRIGLTLPLHRSARPAPAAARPLAEEC